VAIQKYDVTFETLPADVIDAWRAIPSAIATDIMNRSQVMAGRIKPVAHGTRLCGQARTVTCMSGDNSAPHTLIGMCKPGEVMIIDARGSENVAIWGGIMTEAALYRGIAGIVVDGAIRDVSDLRALGFPAYSSSVVPAGPHKGFGGVIDGTISVGDCPVSPGDLIIGDDDGVAVVPLTSQERLLKASLAKIAQEEETIAGIRNGDNTVDRLGLPPAEIIT